MFRVFHGAPGSGKASLMHHIRDTLGGDPKLLFVKADDYLMDKATLVDHIADTAMRRPFERTGDLVNDVKDFFARHMTAAAMAASDAVRMKTAGEALAKWRRAHALGDDFTVVLTFDEAQVLDPSESKVLRSLTRRGSQGSGRSSFWQDSAIRTGRSTSASKRTPSCSTESRSKTARRETG